MLKVIYLPEMTVSLVEHDFFSRERVDVTSEYKTMSENDVVMDMVVVLAPDSTPHYDIIEKSKDGAIKVAGFKINANGRHGVSFRVSGVEKGICIPKELWVHESEISPYIAPPVFAGEFTVTTSSNADTGVLLIRIAPIKGLTQLDLKIRDINGIEQSLPIFNGLETFNMHL